MVKAQQPGDDDLNNAANDDVNNAADDDLNSASDNNMKNAAARIQCAETPSLQPLFDVAKKESQSTSLRRSSQRPSSF